MDAFGYIMIFIGVFAIGLTVAAIAMLPWYYSVFAALIVGGTILLVCHFWKKAKTPKKRQTMETVSKIIVWISVALIVIGLIMFVACFIAGPTGFAETFTECGWCGGSGVVSDGKICRLCNGGGGAKSSNARYTANATTWLGVLMAAAGTVLIFGTKHAEEYIA